MPLGNFLETGNFRDFLRKPPLPIIKPDQPDIVLFPGFYPFYVKFMNGYYETPKFSKQSKNIYPENDRDKIKSQLQTIESRNPSYAFNLFNANVYGDYVSYIYFLNYYPNSNPNLKKKSLINVVTYNLWRNNTSEFLREKDGMDFDTWKKEVDYENYVDYIESLKNEKKKPVEFDKWLTQGFFIKADSETIKERSFSNFEATSLLSMNKFRRSCRAEEIPPEYWKNNGHYFRTVNGYDDYIRQMTLFHLNYPQYK